MRTDLWKGLGVVSRRKEDRTRVKKPWRAAGEVPARVKIELAHDRTVTDRAVRGVHGVPSTLNHT